MAGDIDNMRGDTLRVVEENSLNNMRGVTQRVIQENSIDNRRGVTYRVYNVNGGSTPVIEELNVTPSTSAQTITASGDTDGYSPVNVAAVTSSIDANIVAGNIKKDVSILGVTGSYSGSAGANVQIVNHNGQAYFGTIDLTGIQTISNAVMFQQSSQDSLFKYATGDAFLNANSLTTVSGENAFYSTFNGATGVTSVNLPNLTTVSGPSVFYYAFYGCTGITSINLSNLTTVSGNNAFYYAFYGCTGITSVDLSNLTNASGSNAFQYAFWNCTGITSVDLSNLTTVSGNNVFQYAFYNCTGITSVDLSNLTTISGQSAFAGTFNGCTALTSIYLPKITSNTYASRPAYRDFFAFVDSGLEICDLRNLETVGDYGLFDNMLNGTAALKKVNVNALTSIGTEAARAFMYLSPSTSSTLTDLYFPMLTTFGTNPFYTNAFGGREGLTIHFRKDAQATVEALANYATLWGAGTGSSVVFDLAGTLTGADSNAYARAEKYSVYASETAGAAKTATAWRYNNTTYYTAGDSEPSVGDTIYSDSACTTPVTTISSIA